jgi:hypothetical protein
VTANGRHDGQWFLDEPDEAQDEAHDNDQADDIDDGVH